MSIACIIIAGTGKRAALLDAHIIPAALDLPFREVVVVGEHHEGAGYRYLPIPALTRTTVDALVKRDVATLATASEWLFYVSDDHAPRALEALPNHWLDVGIPTRFCTVNGERIPLNMGLDTRDPNHPYCAGHAGLFSRKLITLFPWSTQPHHPLWDLLSSRSLATFGARLDHQLGWEVEDMEPEARPWL